LGKKQPFTQRRGIAKDKSLPVSSVGVTLLVTRRVTFSDDRKQSSPPCRFRTAQIRIWVGEEEVGFTASVGVSALKTGETNWVEMLRRADVAMYKANRKGAIV
jgi:GGDEF domain-containing protein